MIPNPDSDLENEILRYQNKDLSDENLEKIKSGNENIDLSSHLTVTDQG